MLDFIPENLDFDVTFEPTRLADKKYVIDNNTGEPIAIVGKDFTCATHGDFFRDVIEAATDNLTAHEMQGADIKWRDAHQNGWAMMDMTLPNARTLLILVLICSLLNLRSLLPTLRLRQNKCSVGLIQV